MNTQGISDAFCDAEALATAIDAGLGGYEPLDDALAEYERWPDAAGVPGYAATVRACALPPAPPVLLRLRAGLRGIRHCGRRLLRYAPVGRQGRTHPDVVVGSVAPNHSS